MFDYKSEYEKLMALPNCNDCANVKSCPYRPEWGAAVRVNCPLYIPPYAPPGADGDEFWRELLPDLRKVVGPAIYPFLSSGTTCRGTLNGGFLDIELKDKFVFEQVCQGISREKLGDMEMVASEKAGKKVCVMLLYKSKRGESNA